MAAPTYHTRAFVLKKTKLGETDLIVNLLAEDGSLLRGVAKGARKPKSPFSGRLELFCEANLLMVKGKSLDIVSEASPKNLHGALRDDVVRSAAASCAAELLGHLCQEDLPNPRNFALMEAFLDALEAAPEDRSPFLTAAVLLKAMAVAGFRPIVDTCLACGESVLADAAGNETAMISYSFADGGPVCEDCASFASTVRLPRPLLSWVDTLLRTPFAAIATQEPDADVAISLVQFADAFVQAHIGSRLKSLSFFQTVTIPLIFPCETRTSPLQ